MESGRQRFSPNFRVPRGKLWVSWKLSAPVRSVGLGGATTDATALVVQPDGGGIGWQRRTVRHEQFCLGQADCRQALRLSRTYP
jgi:hypothetical protein